MSADPDRVIRLGEISGVHGVQGWVKVLSFTEPRTNLLDYPKWQLEQGSRKLEVEVEAARESGKRLIAKLAGIGDRDAAAEWIGASIAVLRSALPALASGEYYWADLEGLEVRNTAGVRLGSVAHLIATGANDVLVLDGEGERMIPFVEGETVRSVDIDAGEIVVDWDASYWE